MSKREFLSELRQNLEQYLDSRQADSQVAYYQRYIDEQIRNGRTEAEVLTELGDPRMIARTIIDGIDSGTTYTQNDQEMYHTDYEQNTDTSSSDMSSKVKYYGCLIAVLIVVFAVIILVTRLFIWFLPAIIVVGLILWLLRKINGR